MEGDEMRVRDQSSAIKWNSHNLMHHMHFHRLILLQQSVYNVNENPVLMVYKWNENQNEGMMMICAKHLLLFNYNIRGQCCSKFYYTSSIFFSCILYGYAICVRTTTLGQDESRIFILHYILHETSHSESLYR